MLTEDSKKNALVLGLILIGSLAKNSGNENSDVDIIVVVTDDEFEKRKLTKNYFCGSLFRQADYPAFIDGKIVNRDYLKKVRTDGNESAKNTFSAVKLLYARDNQIAEILNNHEKSNYDKSENIRKFYALMKSNRFRADDDLNNILQLKSSIFSTVFFACRLVLAHNDVRYPCLKNMEREVMKCGRKPENFIRNMRKLLETYSLDELETFYAETEKYFREYAYDDITRKGYVIENEEFWFFNVRPYSEL